MSSMLLITGGTEHIFRELKRSMRTRSRIGSRSFPLGAIIGITIGGTAILLVILVLIAVAFARRDKHGHKRKLAIANEHDGEIDIEAALKSTRPPEIPFSRRLSFKRLPLGGISSLNPASPESVQYPPMAKAKQSFSPTGSFRVSRMRDSWPLFSKWPPPLEPGQPPSSPNPVAPTGYIISESMLPKISNIEISKGRELFSSEDITQQGCLQAPTSQSIWPLRRLQHRSKSETQVSNILRSTSPRFPGVHRQSLTRTLGAPRHLPGLLPGAQLQTSKTQLTERSGVFRGNGYSKSSRSSIREWVKRTKSPGPALDGCQYSEETTAKPLMSMFSSEDFDDSHIGKNLSGVVVPMLVQSSSSTGLMLTTKYCNPAIADMQVQGPPFHIYRESFEYMATDNRQTTMSSTFQEAPGDNEISAREDQSVSSTKYLEGNPFQWSPREATTPQSTRSSPIHKWSGSGRKGHKRSNVVRVSHFPLPPVAPEGFPKTLEGSLLESNLRQNPIPTRLSGSAVSASSDKLGIQPPSSTIFNPSLIASEYVSNPDEDSPTLGPEDTRNGKTCSPQNPLFVDYGSSTGVLDHELFVDKEQPWSRKEEEYTMAHIGSHGRNHTDRFFFSTHTAQQELHDPISLSFQSLANTITPTLQTPRAKPRLSITPMMTVISSPTSPPLGSPAQEFPNAEPNDNAKDDGPPLRESLHMSIHMLRRMNSDVSLHSTASSKPSEHSPSPPSQSTASYSDLDTGENVPEIEKRIRGHGSKYYLSVGMTPPKSDQRSHSTSDDQTPTYRTNNDRRKRGNEELDYDDVWEPRPMSDVATPLENPALSKDWEHWPEQSKYISLGGPENEEMDAQSKSQGSKRSVKRIMISPSKKTSPQWSDL